jgi:hypothetical protein
VHGYGTNGFLFKRAVLDGLDDPFDRAFDLTGGEDYLLFKRLARRGANLVWCDEAVVHEHIPASRGNTWWILKRGFRTGMIFSQSARTLESRRRRAARAVRSLRALIWGVVLLPTSVIRGRASTLHVVRHCSSCVGSLLGLTGLTYQEYRKTHGR